MGLFDRLTRRRAKVGPVLDPAYGDPELTRLRERGAAGDWPGVRAVLAQARDQADLVTMIDVVTDLPGSEEWTGRAVEQDPEDTLALLVSGARQLVWGWEARSGARAKYVGADQWQVFGARLERAEEQLFEVAEREPDWLGPWYFLQITGRGVSVPEEIATRRFEAAVRRLPHHPSSYRQRLQQKCAKWGGSHEQMHSFARTSMLAAPEGSRLGELVAYAHLEHWLDLDNGEDGRYMRSAGVAHSLHEAAERSIWHPDFARDRTWIGAHNAFAMAFALCGENRAASRVFTELDGRVTKSPWAYLGDPVAAFTRSAAAAK
ncbi:hypothetical protein [Kitasatospora sp. CB02891]|uniref:hypothetical protein n=1 Tax=Kitasatospora sp. CB02891 TaxID=2020329 RepID=UPI000C27A444|nr:hypothetical protein [Kitasatospora sp. CB02891]PJN23684.1 hypothetical protein CG736_20615 [Kitasatospora sp. CB02891]